MNSPSNQSPFWPRLSPLLPDGGGANVVFLLAFLGVYALYAAKTGLGVVLRLGRASYYD